MTIDTLKILIVDDDDHYREFLSKVISGLEGVELAAAVSSGRAAVAKLKQIPVDMVLLDIEMPLMDGLETLEKLREINPGLGVIMVSAHHSEKADKVVRALQMGALDFISKSGVMEEDSVLGLRRRLMTLAGLLRVRRNAQLVREKVGMHPAIDERLLRGTPAERPAGPARPVARPLVMNPRIDLVTIGISTGGPSALGQVIPALPEDFNVPVLVVQHMPVLLTASLAESLDRKSRCRVREAEDGEEIVPGTVYMAPGGKHMIVVRVGTPGGTVRMARLIDDPPVNSCRPSVDVLLRSVAKVYDGTILAVIMTGMGNDGMEGVRLLKRRGCYCLCQSEESCVVYGMPRAVDEAGLSDEQVPLDQMGERIIQLVKGWMRAPR